MPLLARDCDEAVAWFTGPLGFTLAGDQHQPVQPYGKVAVFEDLYGNLWDLVQPANEPAHSPRTGPA